MKSVVLIVVFLLFTVVALAVVLSSIKKIFFKQGNSASDSSVDVSIEKMEGVPNERERLATFAVNLILGAFGVMMGVAIILGLYAGAVVMYIRACRV